MPHGSQTHRPRRTGGDESVDLVRTGSAAHTHLVSAPDVAALGSPPDVERRLSDIWSRASRFALPAAILAAIGGVVVATARFGIGLTPDSVIYVNGARSIADGRGYTDQFGDAIGLFAPGYSAMLSLGERLGIDALDFARWLSVVGFVLTVVLAWVLLGRHVRSAGIRAATTILIGCSAVLLEIYAKLLSEHLFVPVILAFVLVGEELIDRPSANRWFAAGVVLAWAAFYLRYAGIVLAVIGGLVVLVAGWRTNRVRAAIRSLGFVFASLSLPVVWMVRNQNATGDLMGPRARSSVTLAGNVRRVAYEMSEWTATKLTPHALRPVAFVIVGVALVLTVFWLWRRHAPMPHDARAMLPLAILIVVYVAYLIGSATLVAFAAIDTRFLVPVYVPVVVCGAWGFEHLRERLPTPALRTLLTVLGVVWIVANGVWFAGRAVGYARAGAGGYATERYQSSPLLRDVDRLDFATPTFTNDPFVISVLLDKDARLSVAASYFNSRSKTQQLPAFLDTVACSGRVRLIWFEPNMRSYLYTPAQLQRWLILKPIVQRRDGTIYDVRPRPGVTPACTR